MKINPTVYNNAGELLAPLPADIDTKHPNLGGIPTKEAGFYHRFKFDALDADEMLAKKARFFDQMRAIPGYSTLDVRDYEVRFGKFYRVGVDIIYVVEAQ